MTDIPPLTPVVPIFKPVKIKRDDAQLNNRKRQKKPDPQKNDPEPSTHIDEFV